MAEAAGIVAVAHSFGELGVATAFMIHAIASSPAFVCANQTAYTFLADDVLAGGMMKFEKGHLPVPTKPGLGIELDPGKVDKYSRLYNQEIKGKEFQTPWQSPKKLFGLESNAEDWVPMSAHY